MWIGKPSPCSRNVMGTLPSHKSPAVMPRLLVMVMALITLVFMAALLIVPWLGKQGWLPSVSAYALVVNMTKFGSLWLAAGGIAATLAALLGRLEKRWVTTAILTSAVFGLIYAGQYVMDAAYKNAPQLWDMQTDLRNPIAFTQRIQDRRFSAPKPNPQDADIQAACCRAIKPMIIDAKPTLAYHVTLAAMKKAGYSIMTDYRQAGQIEGEKRSPWFGLSNHIAARIKPDENSWTTSRVDFRWAATQALGEPATGNRDIQNIMAYIDANLKAHQAKNDAIQSRRPQPRSDNDH